MAGPRPDLTNTPSMWSATPMIIADRTPRTAQAGPIEGHGENNDQGHSRDERSFCLAVTERRSLPRRLHVIVLSAHVTWRAVR